MKRIKLLPILIFTFVTGILVFKFSNKPSGCKTTVILHNGDIIKCKWVNSYNSGFSSIRKCDGSDFQTATANIKQVINK